MKYISEREKVICIDENGNEVGVATFPETEKGVFTINHTFVDEKMQGRGIASELVKRAINSINLSGGEVRTSCSYAQKYIEKKGIRPYVICHMMTSIDGKVTGDFLYGEKGTNSSESYYEINRRIKGDAFSCGRITMEGSFTNGYKPDLSSFKDADVSYEDYVAMKHSYYAVSFDRLGNVGWKENIIRDSDEGYDNCHIIEVLTEKTSAEKLAYYKSIGVSYIFAGKDDIDINTALSKLHNLFGIKKLLLEGGSIINGAFLKAGCVDELSLIVTPVIADKDDKPLFYDSSVTDFEFVSSEKMPDDSLWIRYER